MYEYDVKKGSTSSDLIEQVNESLLNGWELAGGISRTLRDSDGAAYVQAITREIKKEKTK